MPIRQVKMKRPAIRMMKHRTRKVLHPRQNVVVARSFPKTYHESELWWTYQKQKKPARVASRCSAGWGKAPVKNWCISQPSYTLKSLKDPNTSVVNVMR
ncbi:hypothetical protein A142_18065 [Vibrio splendidus 12E03]|uniref:Uncharacterized protein n=1 Tax=Vibrio splendidus 12E03 TaxID=1191305 RepID=A0A1E5FUI3_VIBSP|nr:hypothetical protein A142_18065 [Vibrio splendidus 12E03]